jgi:hypothetical protein
MCALAPWMVLGMGCSSLPTPVVGVLESADSYEIYRLEPNGAEAPKAGEEVFHNHVILGRAEVKDKQLQTKITDIVNKGVGQGGTQAKCFNPRHGIHAVRGTSTVDLVICYECSTVEVGDNGRWSTVTTGDVQSDLDAAFRSAGLPSKE